MTEETVWYQQIRDIHDRHFHDDWQERVNTINQRYRLSHEHMLLAHGPGIPMYWFNGDIHAVEPGCWVLVVSLNHQIDSNPPTASTGNASGSYSEEAWWNYQRKINRTAGTGSFSGPSPV